MKRLFPVALAAALLAVPAAGAATRRVVSLSVCADQFVLALADRGQVAGLSRQAADPHLSTTADLAAGLPRHGGTAEEVLALRPDLVVAGGFARGRTVEMLERLGVPVLRLRTAESLADILPQVTKVAAALGRPAAGEALRARLQAELDGAASVPVRATAALYRPGGDVPGTRGLVGEMMRAAGLDNQAGRLSRRPNGRVLVEQIVAHPPDLLLLDSLRPDRPGLGQSVIEHPALRRVAGRMRVVGVPIKHWLCATPGSVAGVPALRAAIGQEGP